MSLKKLIQEFEDAKQKVEPFVKEQRTVLPIYRVEKDGDDHVAGDGFFYSSPDKISWRYVDSGHNSEATPQNLLEAYKHYKSDKITMEDALVAATQSLNEWYKELRKK